MQIRPSRPLSVIGAMKDIQEYKITKARADIAPTLVERAKLELDWEKKDRPLAREMKEQAVKKGEQDIVAKKRESLSSYYNDTADMSEWILAGKDDEEKQRRFELGKKIITEKHEDHVTSAGPNGKPGDLIGEYDEEQLRTMASMARKKAADLKVVPAGARIADPTTGEVKLEAQFKPGEGPYKEGEIKEFKEGDQFIEKKFTNGEWVPTGTKAPRYKPGVTINMPDTITPSMKTKLQTEMFERQQAIDRLDQIEALTKDEYLTYYGKSKAKVSEMLTKAGLSTDEMEKIAADYEEWVSATKVHTLLWRKLITGVAGGEKEMKAIEETTINVADSAPSFRRKLKRQKIMAEAALQRAQFSIEHFGNTFKDLTPEQKNDVRERFPFVAAAGEQDADKLLKELGYE